MWHLAKCHCIDIGTASVWGYLARNAFWVEWQMAGPLYWALLAPSFVSFQGEADCSVWSTAPWLWESCRWVDTCHLLLISGAVRKLTSCRPTSLVIHEIEDTVLLWLDLIWPVQYEDSDTCHCFESHCLSPPSHFYHQLTGPRQGSTNSFTRSKDAALKLTLNLSH